MTVIMMQQGQRVRKIDGSFTGTVVRVSENLAKVEFDNGTEELFDRYDEKQLTLLNEVILDLTGWTRLAELDTYAELRNISRTEAIKRLVNGGLSHLRHLEEAAAPAPRPRS